MKDGDQLETRLRQAEAVKEGSYDKRTDHLDDRGRSLFINRLILEDSPYLLQHAHNPVNWYAWGSEAFEAARSDAKPIFLSIGYSTCHWCHVMEVESFDNTAVASLLNKHFISIKMDREQYPDIDEIYMTGVQIMSGQGGWPMSNFLLDDGKPFFAGTYFPAPSFIQLLQQIAAAWQDKYQELETSAGKVGAAIDRILSETKQADALDPSVVENTLQALHQREDRSFGGLAGAPKFPQEPLLLLMLDRVARQRDVTAMGFVDRALEGMARGGIYDQIAGGFHRYSVDAQWLVPHFEKMLYNQSQLGLVYLQAYQLTRKPFFERICRQTLDYVLRDMQIPEGGFYSATDADSEGEEGTFFTWTPAELEEILSGDEMQLITSLYGVSAHGNFEGSNILNLSRSLQQSAEQHGGESFYSTLDAILHKLYLSREQRIHPLRDDKLIVAWTSAMTTTLVKAAFSFNNDSWLQAAERAVDSILQRNLQPDGRLLRIYLNETSSIEGQLEDYANLVQALLSLFDVTEKRDYLQQAAGIMDTALDEFWDANGGGFFLGPQQQVGPQLTRSRNASDGATLSPVATALECLVMLRERSALLKEQGSELRYREKIDACIASLLAHINDNPISHSSVLRIIARNQSGSSDAIQYAADGRARLQWQRTETGSTIKLEARVTLLQGWHVTAAQQSSGNFVPLELRMSEEEQCWQIAAIDYPQADGVIDTDGKQLAIYQADFVIGAQLHRSEIPADELTASVGVELELQLCNQQHCLLPVVLKCRL